MGYPTVSVVICAFSDERWDDLVGAVHSVQRQTIPAQEVIVVVDHNPSLYERLCLTIPEVIALENRGAQGLSSARNTGSAVARAMVVAFLDDDAFAEADWLERLTACYADPGILGVGGSIRPAWSLARPRWFPREFDWVVGCTYRGMPTRRARVRNLIGANMSFQREVLEEVGGFRSDIGQVGASMLRCDETELCIRIHRHRPEGLLLYEPGVRVRHRVPASRARWAYFCSRCYTEGLAKAQISRLLSTKESTATERAYTFRTLPLGVVRELGRGTLRLDLGGIARVGAIVAGLAVTTAGYVVGQLGQLKAISMLLGRRNPGAPEQYPVGSRLAGPQGKAPPLPYEGNCR